MKKFKPSILFEGKESSLYKTYQKATMQNPILQKTEQCFCKSIYNGETKQVENCTCGKCQESLKPMPENPITKKINEAEKEFEKRFVNKATDWRENHGWTVDYVDSRADNLKQFLHTQQISLLEEVINNLPNGEKLHEWYLEATQKLHPENYNPKAQKPYSELTEEQKFIDNYIAEKVKDFLTQAIRELK